MKHSEDGEFVFNLLAGNNLVIFTSQVYKEKSGALNGDKSVQKNAAVDAANKEVIGRSQLYKSKEALEKGIASVKKNGPTDPTNDLTHAPEK